MIWILSLGMFICNHVFMYVYICSDKLKCIIILLFLLLLVLPFFSFCVFDKLCIYIFIIVHCPLVDKIQTPYKQWAAIVIEYFILIIHVSSQNDIKI